MATTINYDDVIGEINVLTRGVVRGTLANNTARATNRTNFNNAINEASTNNKRLKVPGGVYEIYGGALIIVPSRFLWIGTQGAVILQYQLTSPVMHIGYPNGSALQLIGETIIDGVFLQYAGTATSGSGGALEISGALHCVFRNMLIGDPFQGISGRTSIPYRGVYIDPDHAQLGPFSNQFENIHVTYWTYRGWEWDRDGATSTGNVFTNVYVSGGGSGGVQDTSGTSGSCAIYWTGHDQAALNQFNLEWISGPNTVQMVDCTCMVFNGINFEGITLKNASSGDASYLFLYVGSFVINGLGFHTGTGLSANNVTVTRLFYLGPQTTVNLMASRIYNMNNNVNFYLVDGFGGGTTHDSRFQLFDLDISNGAQMTAFDGGNFASQVTNAWGAITDFNGEGIRVLADADATIYSYHGDHTICIPATAARVITLARQCTSSIATIIPPGTKKRVVNTGSSTVRVNDYTGGTNLTPTLIAAGTGRTFGFNGSNWISLG